MTLRWWDDVRVLSAPKILDRFCHLHCVYRSLRWFIQEVLWLTSHKTMCFFRWIVSHLAWWNPHCWLGQATTILVASIPTKNGSKSKVFWSIDFFNSPETASSPPLERLEHHPKNSIVYVYLYIYIHMWCICIYIIYIYMYVLFINAISHGTSSTVHGLPLLRHKTGEFQIRGEFQWDDDQLYREIPPKYLRITGGAGMNGLRWLFLSPKKDAPKIVKRPSLAYLRFFKIIFYLFGWWMGDFQKTWDSECDNIDD